MSFGAPETKHYAIELLTEQVLIAGTLELPGMLLNYLNHPDRATLQFKQATATALDAGSKLAAWQSEVLWVRRDEILAIRFVEPVSQDTMQLLPRKEKLRVFLPRFVVQAVFRCGVDTSVGDLFDTMTSYWAPATDALVYASLPCAAPVFSSAQFLLINRRRLLAYQPVKD
jgi:hypothetical protein